MNTHRDAEGGGVEHVPVAHVDADMTDVREEEDQASGLKLGSRYMQARVPQGAGEVRQADAELGVSPADEAGAVEDVRAGPAPDVSVADSGHRDPECMNLDRAAVQLNRRVFSGMPVDRECLSERGAVWLVFRRLGLCHPSPPGGWQLPGLVVLL